MILLAEKPDRLFRGECEEGSRVDAADDGLGVVVVTVEGERRYDEQNLDIAAIIEVVAKAQLANEESEKKKASLAMRRRTVLRSV